MKNYNPPPGKIYFLYQQFQKCYMEIQEKLLIQGIKIEFVQASEFSEQDFKTIAQENPNMEIMVCVDDSSMSTSKSSTLAHLFTVSRHYRISIVLFWHMLFPNTPQSRIIHQNHELFLSPVISTNVQTSCHFWKPVEYKKSSSGRLRGRDKTAIWIYFG